MSGELAPGEIRQRLEDIRHHTELGAEIAVRMSGELSDHIDWLTGELAERDEEIERLRRELAAEEADKAEVVHREESLRIDAEDQLKEAERTIRDLRNQADYWAMGQ